MSWETPSYRDVNMSSEIGAYQDEFEEREPASLEPPDNQATPVSFHTATEA